MKYLLIILTALAFNCFGQTIKYQIVNNSLEIEGVTASNSVLYDNDMLQDTPDVFYLWLKANRKEVNLVGNVNTRDLHPNKLNTSHDATFNTWMKFYNAYVANGMKNNPVPVKGSSRYYSYTSVESSPGSDLIISEAKKASPQKPLVIFIGGQATSVANAFAKDRSIGPNIIVLHIDGYGDHQYNAIDDKACLELINGGIKYISWNGNIYSWYNKAGSPMYSGSNKMPGINLNGMPSNSFSNELRNNWFGQAFQLHGDIGDSPGIFYFFNHSLWQNVIRKNAQKQTVTADNFAYLAVSQNKWADYGPMLNSYVVNPTNYIPVTTTPPVNNPPSVVLNVGASYPAGAVTLYADASDSDGSVSKVEFLVSGNKIGEDISSPYGFVWNATAGTYNVSARAIDNLASSSTSTKSVTITSITVPGDTVYIPGPAGPQGPQGIPGPVGPMGPQGPAGSGSGGPLVKGYYDITAYGAVPDGQTDSREGIQAAIDAAILNRGTLYIPNSNNGYVIRGTLFVQPKAPNNQAFFDIVGQGHYGFQIIYKGPSAQSAVVIIGLKTGNIHRMHVKIDDSVNNSVAFDIGTSSASGSTSVFTFEDCSAELGRGENNIGFRLGTVTGGGADVSQIQFDNVTIWGTNAGISNGVQQHVRGQVGWLNDGYNTLQLTWTACGASFVETGVKATKSGTMYFFGYGASQTAIDFDIRTANNFGVWGGRFEGGKRFLNVDQSANHPVFTISNTTISEYKPVDGILFNFRAPGSLLIEDASIHRMNSDFDSRMITLSTPASNPFGTFSINRGDINASDPFVTSSGWKVQIENVVKLKSDNFQSIGYFTNR